MTQNLLLVAGLTLAMMTVMWLLSLFRRDASIVDPFWGTGFVIIAWVLVAWNWPVNARMCLLAALTTIWGLRLSIYLLFRNWGHDEDPRYRAMREKHGERFWWVSYLTVFLLQGAIMWFVALPQQATAYSTAAGLWWLDATGVTVWAIGFLFESIGDWQLMRFKANPNNQGKVLDRGLWRYSRHPNYFGDFCVWWGIFLIAAAGGAWWTIGSPILMSVLLMKVSGVTLLEKDITQRRPEYARYVRQTNAFFPGLPKKIP